MVYYNFTMRKMGVRLVIVMILTVFQVSLPFAEGFSGGSRGSPGSPAESRLQPRERYHSSYSENGSERRSLSGSSQNSKNNGDPLSESFNPATGWHTVSEPVEVVNYRGNRKVVIDKELSVTKVKAEKLDSGKITVKVLFNQEINPRSFSASNLKINGKIVTDDVKFSFSNKGDCVLIQIPAQSREFSLAIDNVEAFDGEQIPEINLGNFQVN